VLLGGDGKPGRHRFYCVIRGRGAQFGFRLCHRRQRSLCQYRYPAQRGNPAICLDHHNSIGSNKTGKKHSPQRYAPDHGGAPCFPMSPRPRWPIRTISSQAGKSQTDARLPVHPCLYPLSHQLAFPPEKMIEVSRLGVTTGIFTLYEIERRQTDYYRQTAEIKPSAIILKMQGRFSHLTAEESLRFKKMWMPRRHRCWDGKRAD